MEPASFAEMAKLAAVELVGLFGALSMVVSGGVVSMSHWWGPAGEASTLPAASMARTWKSWLPSPRPV